MNKFEEYKYYSERTLHLSDRRQTATQIYLTINTGIFTVLAFLIKDAGFSGVELILVCLPLLLVGTMVCFIWHKTIMQYKALIGWHYEQLREMENTLLDSHQVLRKEYEKFFRPQQKNEKFGFARLEAWLPRLFSGVYVAYGVGMLTTIAFGWI